MAVEGVVSFRISHESGGNGAAPKQFTLAQGEDKAIRIGRAPGNDILVEHRGVSQYHAEVRLAEGGSEPRLCIRDLSMNGTGLKRPGSETPSSCPKNTDDALPDGAVILVPMMLKADAQRAWLRVQILGGLRRQQRRRGQGGRGEGTRQIRGAPAQDPGGERGDHVRGRA